MGIIKGKIKVLKTVRRHSNTSLTPWWLASGEFRTVTVNGTIQNPEQVILPTSHLPLILSLLLSRRRTGSSDPHSHAPSYAHRPTSPEGSQVNVMGVHTVPGSPNTLHRTVATNTPPSPALQRRLGQASPSLARHQSPAGANRDSVPSSPLIGRNPKTAAAGVPPSPLMGRRTAMSGHSTPDDIGPPPSTPAFPVSPQLPEKRHMSTGDVERTDNKNLMAGTGSSAPNLSGMQTLTDVPKSIYGEAHRRNIRNHMLSLLGLCPSLETFLHLFDPNRWVSRHKDECEVCPGHIQVLVQARHLQRAR